MKLWLTVHVGAEVPAPRATGQAGFLHWSAKVWPHDAHCTVLGPLTDEYCQCVLLKILAASPAQSTTKASYFSRPERWPPQI